MVGEEGGMAGNVERHAGEAWEGKGESEGLARGG